MNNKKIKYICMVAFAAACNGLLSIIFKYALNDNVNMSYLLLMGASIAAFVFSLIIIFNKRACFNSNW